MDLVAYYKNKNTLRVRQALNEIKDSALCIDREIMRDACEFFTRKNDIEQIRRCNANRYAMELVEHTATNDGIKSSTYSYEPSFVANRGEVDKFSHNVYETLNTGTGQTILNTIANLFTSHEQTWRYMADDKPSEDAAKIISSQREQGGFDEKIVACDYIASAADSCLLHVYPKGEWLAYDIVWPSDVYLVFGDSVREIVGSARREIVRPVDTTDIDDAWAVIIRVAGKDSTTVGSNADECTYLAYIGACDTYDLGRMVTYTARSGQYWPIPDVGDASVKTEYRRGNNEVCNPLTWIAKFGRKGVGGGYEYPVALIRGDMRFGATDAIPTTSTFLHNIIEIESMFSKAVHESVKSSRGKDVFSMGVGSSLPDSLDVIIVDQGVTYNHYSGDAAGVAQLVETSIVAARSIGASRGVPPYVIVGTSPGQPESGIALALRTAPLKDSRNRRIKMNTQQVAKIYDIESGLLFEIFPEAEKVFAGVKQVWNAGAWVIPQDNASKFANIKSARDMELIDHIESVRQGNDLATDEDAIKLIEQFAERDPDYRGIEKPEEQAAPFFEQPNEPIEEPADEAKDDAEDQ